MRKIKASGDYFLEHFITMLRYEADKVTTLLGVPAEDGWKTAMLALGYPLGRWAVAANRRPVHEVSSRNRWGKPFGPQSRTVVEPFLGAHMLSMKRSDGLSSREFMFS